MHPPSRPPPGAAARSSYSSASCRTAEEAFVDRAKEEIKNAPEFHPDKHLDDAGYRRELGTYYGTGAPFGGRPA
ncbi:hypothetical protein [Streptomyces avidinii]